MDIGLGLAKLPTHLPAPSPSRPPAPSEDTPTAVKTSTSVEEVAPLTENPAKANRNPDFSSSPVAVDDSPCFGKSGKRVEFSPWTQYHKAPLMSSEETHRYPLKLLPPSRERNTPTGRSILKPFDRPLISDTLPGDTAQSPESFAKMLESVVQQLASDMRSAKLDAYRSLIGALKAYESVPDPEALVNKMGLLMQFTRRDMCAKDWETDVVDTILVVQALKLLSTILCLPIASDKLSDEFCSFVVDRSTSAIEDEWTPKAMVTHYMQILSSQRFGNHIMTTARANRLLAASYRIQERIKGNAVIAYKIAIYQRLLEQVRPVMIHRVSDWIDHTFFAMLSVIKPVRARAITFGMDAALILGTTSTVSHAVMDLFNKCVDGEKNFVDSLCDELNRILSSREDAVHVPQIWSVPVLFLRSRRQQLEDWEHMKAWIYVIQRCFNSSDATVKVQAHLAWNRLVFAIGPDAKTGQTVRKLLKQPIVSQLDRKTAERNLKPARQVAFASYFNLLYYALNPSATSKDLDLYWTEYISEIFTDNFLSRTANFHMACDVLANLFGNGQVRVWNEDRANVASPVRPEELPRLDPKWVRSRVEPILGLFERIFQVARKDTTPKSFNPITQAWQNFMRAIADAGSKEVKVSEACMVAIAQVLNMLERIWETGPSALGFSHDASGDDLVSVIATLLDSAISHIGSLAFTENLLLRNSAGLFLKLRSPSHMQTSTVGYPVSPTVQMLQLFGKPKHCPRPTEWYQAIVSNLLRKAMCSRTSRGAQLELLREWTQAFFEDSSSTYDTVASIRIWTAIAELARTTLTSISPPQRTIEDPRHIGHEYRDVAKILEAGLKLRDIRVLRSWKHLYQSLVLVVHREIGEGGIILAVLEPLADVTELKECRPSQALAMNCAILMLEHVLWPSSVSTIESSHKALWGTACTTSKAPIFDHLDRTCSLINHILETSYRETTTSDTQASQRFLDALRSVVQRVPLPSAAIFLKRIQTGLAVWIRDEARKVDPSSDLLPNSKQNVSPTTH